MRRSSGPRALARAKRSQIQMNKRFSRIALVGKVEDARVVDSMVARFLAA